MADAVSDVYNSLDNTAMSLGLGESDEAKRKREKAAKRAAGGKKPKAPIADSAMARASASRSASRRFSGGGRASTMLTGDDKLG